MPQDDLFQFLARECRAAGVRWLVVGGFAVNYHGVSRNTGDIDLLIRADDYPAANQILKRIGFEEYQRTDAFARLRSTSLYLMGVDFAFVSTDTFEKLWRESLETSIGSTPLRVVSLQHLLAMKLNALAHGSARRWEKDLPDIIELARANHVSLDSAEFRALCRQFANDQVLAQILALTEKGPPKS